MVAPKTDRARGWVKGQPQRYINGHNPSGAKASALYLVKDCGYESSCWVWQQFVDEDGYGRWTRGGRSGPAHRLMFEALRALVPKGMELDHLCRNRACVNPAHLEVVTRSVNAWRGRGTKLTPDEARAIRDATGVTQAELALRFGVSRQQISKIQRGTRWAALEAA